MCVSACSLVLMGFLPRRERISLSVAGIERGRIGFRERIQKCECYACANAVYFFLMESRAGFWCVALIHVDEDHIA
jgi:hypothetical protein